MASLAHYSHELHDAPTPTRPAPGSGSRVFGLVVYAAIILLVAAAALQTAG